MKSGFVGIIGRPNVGKSTLLNSILGEKIAITSDKAQTTRNAIRGIYSHMEEDECLCQLVFIDTPGIHKPKNALGSYMTDTALNTFKEVDTIIFMVDSPLEDRNSGDRYILSALEKVDTPKMLVINKIDKIDPETFASMYREYEEMGIFEEIIGTNALEGKNVDVLLEKLEERAEEGPMYFPPDMVTDHPERFLVSEIIREKILLYLNEEVPHGVAVEIEAFDESGKVTKINAAIYCEKQSHKGIIIGKKGHTLKGIGMAAREEIEALLGCRVYLELFVKVKEHWRDSTLAISNFGYK